MSTYTLLVFMNLRIHYHGVYMFLLISVMGGFLGLTIVYTYACSGEVTGLPIDIAWSYTNLWSGMGILIGPFFSGKYTF